jgi:hypothetical protein
VSRSGNLKEWIRCVSQELTTCGTNVLLVYLNEVEI